MPGRALRMGGKACIFGSPAGTDLENRAGDLITETVQSHIKSPAITETGPAGFSLSNTPTLRMHEYRRGVAMRRWKVFPPPNLRGRQVSGSLGGVHITAQGRARSPLCAFPGDMAHPCASARQAKQAAHCGRVAVDGGGGLRVKRNTADAPTLGGGVRGKTESLNGAGLRRRIGRQITKIGRQITNGAPSRRLTGITSHAYPFPRAVRAAASRGRPRCAPVLVPSVS